MLRVLLELGRISNLPTVWTNCLAAVVLAQGGAPFASPRGMGGAGGQLAQAAVALLAMSLMYTGGMFLNDAFDREVDRAAAPTRPIPAGRISAGAVFWLGGVQLGVALGLVAALSWVRWGRLCTPALGAAGLLAVLVLYYDFHHKKNPLSPVVMGLCRVGVYFSVGLLGLGAQSEAPLPAGAWQRLGLGSAVLLAYLMALTFFAKREGRGVPSPLPIPVLIAGISLVDGLLMAASGVLAGAVCGGLGFWATLRLQRWVRGT